MARPVVCVVGAGTAGLEGLLAAREVLGSRAELRLIAPDREFRYRPMSHESLFRPTRERGLAVADVVAEAEAVWVTDLVEVVREAERSVLTRDGDTVEFDFLLLTVGARPKRALRQGYVWERGEDPSFLDQIMLQIVAGEVMSVAVVVPRGARWPVPAYELALVLAWTAAKTDARVTLITAEQRPLALLGLRATDLVARELADAGVETLTGVEVIDEPRGGLQPAALADFADVTIVPEEPAEVPGALIGKPTQPARVRMSSGSTSEFDRLISLPTMSGSWIAGVACDVAGFIEVDEGLKVCGSQRTWAAGSCVASALEHTALAARQADAAIAAIAAASPDSAAARPPSSPAAPELTGILLTGQRDRWLAENPVGTQEPSTRCLWWPPGRAVGRMLAHRIAAWDPTVHHALPGHPGGLAIRTPVALGCSEMPTMSASVEVSDEVRAARLRDIENRQLLAVQRHERAAEAQLRALKDQLRAFTAHEQEVIRELQQHGYLRDRDPTRLLPDPA